MTVPALIFFADDDEPPIDRQSTSQPAVQSGGDGQPSHRRQGQTTIIRIGHSPDITPLFQALITAYNQQSRDFKVERLGLDFDALIDAAVNGELVGVSPDASLVLNEVERAWQVTNSDSPPLVGYTIRYASSPVVIAIREDRLGGAPPTGWQGLIASNLKWAHLSSLTTSSGLLTLAAEFYAAAGVQRLDRDDVDRLDVLERVRAIESSVARYGGESEEKVVEYLLTPEGIAAIDAMVLSEAQIVSLNQQASARNIATWRAIYPDEGTLMMDHPLTLLEHPTLSPEARRAFLDFTRFIATEPMQNLVIEHGYRPVAYDKELDTGPLTPANGVNPAQPKLLPLPSPGTLMAMRAHWASGLKRPANILLVVDVSGSMREDQRMPQAKQALEAFVITAAQKGTRDRIGLSTFSDDYAEVVPIKAIGENRQQLLNAIRSLEPRGNTALFYSAWIAQQKLLSLEDPERINAVVLMTDGLENGSRRYQGQTSPFGLVPSLLPDGRIDTRQLVAALKAQPNADAGGVLLFTIGYGKDADENTMRQIAGASGGQYYFAEPSNITQLYALIQGNF
ncbi:MAG TPA: VWA domain-containing protein [Chloroflexota bacterium]|nr:VWA domain-containing protein [Chloroflexota bacterium]